MTEPDYKALRSQPRKKHDEATAAARLKEQRMRAARAQSRALRALSRFYPDAYRSLYRQAFDEVYEESGPLPGDDT